MCVRKCVCACVCMCVSQPDPLQEVGEVVHGGDVVAMGLYLHIRVDVTGEETVHKDWGQGMVRSGDRAHLLQSDLCCLYFAHS